MFSYEMNFLVSQEQQRDRLRQIERQRLVRTARHQAGPSQRQYRQVMIRWLGRLIVRVGTQLQGQEAVSSVGEVRPGLQT